MKNYVAILPISAGLVLAACTVDLVTDVRRPIGSGTPVEPTLALVDAIHNNGSPFFLWQTTVAPNDPTPTGPFDAARSPEVEICEVVNGSCVTTVVLYNMVVKHQGGIVRLDTSNEVYKVLFRTDRFTLDVDTEYRIVVREGGNELGSADLDLVQDAAEADLVDRSEFVPVINGTTLNIRFRLEVDPASGMPSAVADDYSMDVNTTLDGSPAYLPDASLRAAGSDVSVTFESTTGSYSSDVMYYPTIGGEGQLLFNNLAPGPGTAQITGLVADQELIFGIVATNPRTGLSWTFYTGDASNNPDGVMHARAWKQDGKIYIGFEDKYGGGDHDYDDVVFEVNGVIDPGVTGNAADLMNNDTPGSPAASLVSFGGGSLGGDETTHDAGSSVPVSGGTLTVHDDGSFSLVDPTADGGLTFDYKLENTEGASVATVTIMVSSNATVAEVIVTPSDTTLSLNGSLQLTAEPRDATGNPLARPVTWASSDPTVASVNATGLVAAVAPGNVTITATSEGIDGTANVEVSSDSASGSVDQVVVDPLSATLVDGESLQATAQPQDAAGNPLSRPVTWTSTDPSVATVTTNGLVTGVDAGAATIMAASDGVTGTSDITVVAFASGFHWRQPVVPNSPPATGPFDPTLSPEVDICELSGAACAVNIVTYNMTERIAGGIIRMDDVQEVYRVVFRTDRFSLDVNKGYRIIARIPGQILGTREIDLVTTQAEADQVDQNVMTPIINGEYLNIKFRLEQGTAGNAPVAQGDAYQTIEETPLSRSAADPDDLLDNDDLGTPASTVASFGGGDVGGDATTYAAGSTVPLVQGSGSVTVNADGSFDFVPPTGFTGPCTFEYLSQNSVGGSTATVVITVNAGGPDDTYSASGNIEIDIGAASGVLANDAGSAAVTSVEGSAGNVGTSVPTAASGRNGVRGSVRLNADGSFTYVPPPGFEGADTFVYGTDNGVSGTVTVNVNDMVWFIDNSAGGLNTGTFQQPFQSLADFNAANGGTGVMPDPKPGDFVALRTGAGVYSEPDGINLLDGQQLIGEAVPFNSAFTADANSIAAYHSFSAGSSAAPVIEVTGPDNNGIDLGADNTLRGLTVGNTVTTSGTNSYGISGAAVGNLVVNTVSVFGEGGALNLADGIFGSNVVFDEVSSANALKRGIRLNGNSGTLTVTDPLSSISGSTFQAVRIGGGDVSFTYPGTVTSSSPRHMIELINTEGGTVAFTGTVSQAAAEGKGIILINVATDVTFADADLGTPALRNGGPGGGVWIEGNSTGTFTFTNLDAYVTTATNPDNAALRVNNTAFAGTVTVVNGVLDAEGGPAINVELTELNLTSVEAISTNSPGEGIRLWDVTGSARINGTTSTTSSTTAGIDIRTSAGDFLVDLSSATVTSPGTDGIKLASTGTGRICLNLTGNAVTTPVGSGFVLESTATSVFQLQGFTGDGSVATDVENWVTSNGNTGSVSVLGTFFTGAAGTCVP